MSDIHADLLVVGAGMAGLTAAARVASIGAQVVVVEKSERIGGSAALSGGYVWTAPSLESLIDEDPDAEPSLLRVLVEEFDDAVAWVRSTGADVSESLVMREWGRGHAVDILEYLHRCRRLVEQHDGVIALSCELSAIERVGDGSYVACASDRDGRVTVSATNVLLTTGGFQGDCSELARQVHPDAGKMLLRSNLVSDGQGVGLGANLGGSLGASRSGFYGHLICSPVDRFGPGEFVRLAQYHSVRALLINRRGERFVDESLGDHKSTVALVAQRDMRALLITDDDVWRAYGSTPPSPRMEVVDRFMDAELAGANVVCARSLDQLCRFADEQHFDGRALERTIEGFNAGCESGTFDGPSRVRNRFPVQRPPFRAVEVQPSITFTYGGLCIDRNAQVVDESGHAIRGLYAAGADAAVYRSGYAGGLALALIFGLRAANALNPGS